MNAADAQTTSEAAADRETVMGAVQAIVCDQFGRQQWPPLSLIVDATQPEELQNDRALVRYAMRVLEEYEMRLARACGDPD